MTPILGTIQAFGFNFAPRGWAMCQGQILAIAQNTALFSLLGTMYGGNGQTTFALPDLRGRSLVGIGNGPGLSSITQGEMSGSETHTLIVTEMPAHNHVATVQLGAGLANTANGAGGNFAANTGGTSIYNTGALGTLMAGGNVQVGIAGGSQPFSIRNPYLGMNICIATVGIYPSRN